MIKNTIKESYFHLITVFVIAVTFLKFNIISPYFINFVLFAVIIGFFGYSLSSKSQNINLPFYLVYVAFFVALILRIIPYIGNSVPLGYDPGMYKIMFENPFGGEWIKGNSPFVFVFLMAILNILFGSDFLLIPLFILLSALTVFLFYYSATKMFGKDIGILSSLIFMVSITQFQAFWFNYYKNVFGIMLLLLSYTLFKVDSKRNWPLIIVGGLIMGFHQPAFLVFGLSYLGFLAFNRKNWLNLSIDGFLILAIAFLINFDRIPELMLSGIFGTVKSVVELEGGSGTFFSASNYLIYTLPFIPFAITGAIHYWRKNVAFFIGGVSNLIIVVFGLIFHNRMIIYLDVFVIIYAALGIYVLLLNNKTYGKVIGIGFIILSTIVIGVHSYNSEPLISSEEFEFIKSIDIEENATLIVTDRYYSPWVAGYVDRRVVAPGLFDENLMNKDEWIDFWSGNHSYVKLYPMPVYVYIGERQKQYSFEDGFEKIDKGLYRYKNE
jgi:hypothetical protein